MDTRVDFMVRIFATYEISKSFLLLAWFFIELYCRDLTALTSVRITGKTKDFFPLVCFEKWSCFVAQAALKLLTPGLVSMLFRCVSPIPGQKGTLKKNLNI